MYTERACCKIPKKARLIPPVLFVPSACSHKIILGMISLGGGLPSSEYFPFERIDLKVPTPPHFSEHETKETGMMASAGKHDFAEGKSLYG